VDDLFVAGRWGSFRDDFVEIVAVQRRG
jgi:hypothetical protein